MTANPYQAPGAPVSDPPARALLARPRAVKIALGILWFVLAAWLLGSVRRLSRLENMGDLRTLAYVAYLVAMSVVPTWLLIKITQGRNWARIAAVVLIGLSVLGRVFLLVTVNNLTPPMLSGIFVPGTLQLVAILLLFLPRSSAWFRGAASS